MTRRPSRWAVRREGEVAFADLPGDVRDDIVVAMADGANVEDPADAEDVRATLSNSSLPLVTVATKLVASPRRSVSRPTVEHYRRAREAGAVFPPIVIDSRERILHEGGHRVASALLAGEPRILAVDIAAPRIVEIEDPYARGHFFSAFEFG